MQADDAIRRELLECLEYQRASVRAIVDGLNEAAWHAPVVSSGWTVAGMIEHLGSAERHWFQGVVTGSLAELPWDEGRPPYDPEVAFTCERPSLKVLGYYREQCDRADEILARAALSDAPLGRHGDPEYEPPNIRQVVLHVIEETAAHTGHLEIARELLDGKTGLGLR
ncbi:MAG TPA: DinB family protein [Trebonia sp.]